MIYFRNSVSKNKLKCFWSCIFTLHELFKKVSNIRDKNSTFRPASAKVIFNIPNG